MFSFIERIIVQQYIAHFVSPAKGDSATGVFEFESDARANSKANLHDARLKMLETFGKEAVSWTIDSVERKKADDIRVDNQMELDFREPAKKKRPRKKEWW